MDFASLMKTQIGKSTSDVTKPEKKYLRRGDVESQRREAYAKEQEELERARLERLEKKRKRDDEEADRQRAQKEKKARLAEESRLLREQEAAEEEATRRKKLGLPDLQIQTDTGEEHPLKQDEDDVSDEELRQRLRRMEEPRTLFGESHVQRLRRWRDLSRTTVKVQMSSGPIPTSLELVEEKHMKVSKIVPNARQDRLYLYRQLASYFDMVLSEWAAALSRRPREVKESFTGKQAYNNYAAAISNLTPLFRKLENKDLPDDILIPVVEIVDLAQSKRYVDANDAYLRLSIGNTAWPIGVTMVGIHERSAREKLHEDGNGAAHIMSDEATRKMIQGIKRALTFAQTKWPPDELGQLMG